MASDLAATFDRAARDYDAVRPRYPAALVGEVFAVARLGAGARVLEIGCGTGQATVDFAARGARVVALDMGEQLTAIARLRCSGLSVTVERTRFEEWPLSPEPFDAVLAASAFHWLPQPLTFDKSARALRRGGHLVVLDHLHPMPYRGFFDEVQEVYRRVVPEWERSPTRWDNGIVDERSAAIAASRRFAKPVVRTVEWTERYSRDDYLRLIGTYSHHLALGAERLARLQAEIGALVDARWGGFVDRPYLSVAWVASKIAEGR